MTSFLLKENIKRRIFPKEKDITQYLFIFNIRYTSLVNLQHIKKCIIKMIIMRLLMF